MGFSIKDDDEVISEINVTPLVDVMLVLLVIFMISAPLMFNGINLKLPKTKKVQGVHLKKQHVIISINSSGDVFLGKHKVLQSEIVELVKRMMSSSGVDTVFLRADYRTRYGEIAAVMSFLKNNGIQQISLITDLDKD